MARFKKKGRERGREREKDSERERERREIEEEDRRKEGKTVDDSAEKSDRSPESPVGVGEPREASRHGRRFRSAQEGVLTLGGGS